MRTQIHTKTRPKGLSVLNHRSKLEKMLEMLEILLPHSSSKLELPMNFNAIFKNVFGKNLASIWQEFWNS